MTGIQTKEWLWDIYHQTPTHSLIMGIYPNVSISNYLGLGIHGIFLVWWILPTRLLRFHRKSTVCVHCNQNTKHSSSGLKWTRVYLYSLPLQLGNSLFIFVHSCPTVRTNNRQSAVDETAETAAGAAWNMWAHSLRGSGLVLRNDTSADRPGCRVVQLVCPR